jgi:hypothetical protein
MALVYLLMTILVLLLSLIVVRYIVFGAVWISTGHFFWLFPNLMSDEVGCVLPVCVHSACGCLPVCLCVFGG